MSVNSHIIGDQPSNAEMMAALRQIEIVFPWVTLEQIIYQLHHRINIQKDTALLTLIHSPITNSNQFQSSRNTPSYKQVKQLAIKTYLQAGYGYNKFIDYISNQNNQIPDTYQSKTAYFRIIDSSLIENYLLLLQITQQTQNNHPNTNLKTAKTLLPILRHYRNYLSTDNQQTWQKIIAKNSITQLEAKQLSCALRTFKYTQSIQEQRQSIKSSSQEGQNSESTVSKNSQPNDEEDNYRLITSILDKIKEQQELPQCLALNKKFKRLVEVGPQTTQMIVHLPQTSELRNILKEYNQFQAFDLNRLSCAILSVNEFVNKKQNQAIQLTLQRAKANNSINRQEYAFQGKRKKVLVLKREGKRKHKV